MIRRFLTGLLLVVLVGLSGYNWLQVRALQAQVAELQKRMASRAWQAPSATDWLEQANRHAGAARQALARSDWKTARRELEFGMTALQKAAQSPEARQERTLLQVQMKQLGQQANALWRRAASQTGRSAR